MSADFFHMRAGKDFSVVGVKGIGDATPFDSLFKGIHQAPALLLKVVLGMYDQSGVVIDDPNQVGFAGFTAGALQSYSVHRIAHPQLIGQGFFKGFGRPAFTCMVQARRQAAPIELMLPQITIDAGERITSRFENALPFEMAKQAFHAQARILKAQLAQLLAHVQRKDLGFTPIFARLIMQAFVAQMPVAIIPFFQRRDAVVVSIVRAPGTHAQGMR